MRVRLVKGVTARDYARLHANGQRHFDHWLSAMDNADWNEPADITRSFKGNLLGGGSNRVVFDLGGNGSNSFRIICSYAFGKKWVHVFLKWIGTHEAYNYLTEAAKRTIAIF